MRTTATARSDAAAPVTTTTTTTTTDGLVDDHVPLNRIVVINPDVQPHNISSGETTTTDEEDDDEGGTQDDGPAEANHAGDGTTSAEDAGAGMTAKFIESPAAASGWLRMRYTRNWTKDKTRRECTHTHT